MTESHPAPPSSAPLADEPLFTPVATNGRRDGWTPERQRRFVEALAVMGTVSAAARAVGMSAAGAYKLRTRPDAAGFAQAWDLAVSAARDRFYEQAMDRAINGVEVPRFYRGRLVAVVRRPDYRLALAALPPIDGGTRIDRLRK